MLGALPRSLGCDGQPCPRQKAMSKRHDLPPLFRNSSCSAAPCRSGLSGCVPCPAQNGTAARRPSTPSGLSLARPSSRPSSSSRGEGASREALSKPQDAMPYLGMGCMQAKLETRTPSKMELWRKQYQQDRATELAAKVQKELEHKDKLQFAKQSIMDVQLAAGEPDFFVKDVVASIEKQGALLKVWQCGEIPETIDDKLLQTFQMKAKAVLFSDKLMRAFPPWSLSGLQKECVVQCVLANTGASALNDWCVAGSKELVWREALQSAMRTSELFTCPICMDPLVQLTPAGSLLTGNMWFAPLRKNEHWSSQPCGHSCCRACMAMWAETSINDQKVNVRCPAPNCNYSLFDHDLQSLVAPATFERHQEHKNADYLKHLKTALKEDASLNHWLKSHCRPCPECHVIVSRSEGCDHMQCVCGTNFCYRCGFKSCKCHQSKKRPDIWKPKAQHKSQAVVEG